MDNYTNEKSLVVVQDNFLTKIKNFFAKAFWGRKSKFEDIEPEEEYTETIEEEQPTEKQRKLYDFDADNTEEWAGEGYVNIIENENSDSVAENTDENQYQQEENLEEQYDREIYTEAYIEKQKLEQQLLNYYESIKNGIQFE